MIHWRYVVLAPVFASLLPGQGTWRPLPEFKQRGGHAMAYDPIRKRVVLFGGVTGQWSSYPTQGISSESILTDDTWEWDGRRWYHRWPKTSPCPRRGHRMAWDPVGKRVLLFGGGAGGPMFNDTWAWDGQDWTQLSPKHAPSPRAHHSMATDPVRRRIVLFGGMLTWAPTRMSQNDTWEWDGNDWIQCNPSSAPMNRSGHGSAFCWRSQRVVVFAGINAWMSPTDPYTWEWDGSTWTRHDPKPAPPLHGGGLMAEEPTTGGILWEHSEVDTIGKYTYNDDWIWDGKGWTHLPVDVKRFAQKGGVFVTDSARREILAVGGSEPYWPRGPLLMRQTWAWNGKSWRQVADWPVPIGGFAIVHDDARDQFLFLGGDGSSKQMDTWAMTGNEWKKLQPATSPPTRTQGACVAYHAGLRKVVLHGARRPNWPHLHDTWLWDGRTWTEAPSKIQPPLLSEIVYDAARDTVIGTAVEDNSSATWEWSPTTGWSERKPLHGLPRGTWPHLAYDAARERVVCFTSTDFNTSSNELWEWDGRDWHKFTPAVQPPPRDNFCLVYVPALGGTMLFGGWGPGAYPTFYQDFWLWDGTSWTKLQGSPPPTDRCCFSGPLSNAAYDGNRQRIVACFSFYGEPGRGTLWEYRVETLQATQPYPRPGERLSLDITLPGQAGRAALYALSTASQPGIPLRPMPGGTTELLPLAPDALLWASLAAPLLRVLDAQGTASLPLIIPKDNALIGLTLHTAAFTLDGKRGIGAITNRVPIEIVQ